MDVEMSPDSDGLENISGDAHANILISNIDVKKRNFMKTINFETVRTNNGAVDAAEYSMDSDGLEEQSLVSDVTSDVNSDLLEQQQAREQTRLLDRFKQLREWQTQQQEQLMRQQEQQLAQFHSEQEKLQQLILRQRNAHWGSNPPPPQHNGSLRNGRQHESPQKTSSLSKLESQLPHAIAGSAFTLARCQQEIIQQMATPTKSMRRPRRHSVSSLSTQEDLNESYDETADTDRNNCNTHVNSGDPWTTTNAPTLSSGHGRTTIPEEMVHASSHALRHPGHGPLHTHLDLSVTGHTLLPMGGYMTNTNHVTHDSDDDSEDSQVTIDESVVSVNNGWPSEGNGVNEVVQCSMEDCMTRTSEGTRMDNTDWSSRAVATQYNSPGQLHRHRNHDRIIHQHLDRGQHVLRVSDEGTNTEHPDDVPMRRHDMKTHGETSGSESDASTRRVLFPDSATRPHDHSPSARLAFHRPQFDNFSETGSYSPPREQRPDNKMDSRGRDRNPPTDRDKWVREHDPHTDRDDRARWEREHYASSCRDAISAREYNFPNSRDDRASWKREQDPPNDRGKWRRERDLPTTKKYDARPLHDRAIFNTSFNNDTRSGGVMPPQWSTGKPGLREERRITVDDNEWQPMSPPRVSDERPIRGTHKTFEQLLEEKLKTAIEQDGNSLDNEKGKRLPTTRNFLRRGSRRPYCASKDKMRQQRQAEEIPVHVQPMVSALLEVAPSTREAKEPRLLGESQIIDGPNVRDEPSPPKSKTTARADTPLSAEKKSPPVTPQKKPDKKKSSLPKAISPKPVSPKSSASPKSAPPKIAPPQKEVRQKVKEVSPPKDKGQENVLTEAFEQDELDEFELLEQFAEDDASFLSSVSAVNKVLQQKKATHEQTNQQTHPQLMSRFSTADSLKQASKKSSTSGDYDNVSYFTQASIDAAAGAKPGTKQVRKVARLDRRTEPSEKHKSVLYFGKAPVVMETKGTCTSIQEELGVVSDYESPVEIDVEEGKNSDMNFADDGKSWDTIYETEAVTQTSDPKLSPRERRRQQKGPSPPPTSVLVTKLFPDLKAKGETRSQEKEQQEKKLEAAKQAEITKVGLQSKELRDRLLALEAEIEQFRRENATLEKLRKEREEGLEHLKREMIEFEKQKAEEMTKLQEFKNDEIKKLKRERKLFEQHQKVTRAMADKEQREEIDRLRQQLADLKEEMKKKEQRSLSNTTRLRERLEAIELENQEMKKEIRLLEQKRLEEWQRRETAASTATAAMNAMSKHSGKRQETKASQVTLNNESEPLTQVNQAVTHRLSGVTSDVIHHVPGAGLDLAEATPQEMHSSHRPSEHDVVATESTASEWSAGVTVPRKVAGGPGVMTIINTNDKTYEEVVHADGKVERIYSNNAREILFANGTRKQISADGLSVVVSFFNGDIKQMMPDQRVVYYYADAKTTHTTYSDGLEILHFPTGQTEKHYPDGTREISFPDQTIKYLFPNGTEESIFVDGTVIRIDKAGNKTMEFPNGQREVHTGDFKRREYPDGTTKTVFPDGRQETLYSSGRFRVKDKEGKVIVDKRVPTLESCPG